jgi:hypothetical protein
MQQGFQESHKSAEETPSKSNDKIKKKLSWLKGLVKLPESPTKNKLLPSQQSPNLSRKSSLASFKDRVLNNMGRSDSSLSLQDSGAPALRMPTQHVFFPALSIAMLRQTPKIHAKRLPPLLKAIYTGDLKRVNGILAKNEPGEVDSLDPLHGFAPLHLAVEMESLLIVRELLGSERFETGDTTSQQFANPDVADFQGRTSLMTVRLFSGCAPRGTHLPRLPSTRTSSSWGF